MSEADEARLELALFRHRAEYLSAKAARPEWRAGKGAPSPRSPLEAELDRDRWHREQSGRGVLALHALRGSLGAEAFAKAMDAYGRANGGKEVTVAGFAAEVGRQTGQDVGGFLSKWSAPTGGAAHTATRWLDDPENAVIVYGTAQDVAANEATAKKLQEDVRVRWSNVTVPTLADTAVSDADLKGRHVVLIGRPATNALARRFADAFPVVFGPASFRMKGKVYAHEGTAVVAAGANPIDPRYSAVLIAGLSADATYRAPAGLLTKGNLPAEVFLLPHAGKPTPLVVTSSAGK